MDEYSNNKKIDLFNIRNAEESEERSEEFDFFYFDSKYLNIRNIHNKSKIYR